ncbi:hypothetical protein SAMN05421736_10346 [Evansella caseinilytica]|uniref:Uncharacterized protein n=1 Tax=Evansella caseinilytica TaxID=1503961 RepID=A0A1H3LYM5_9BACI|nr:hypothetical protein SAMN05421736_10346 [Evansella caseinilytica]
MSLFVQSRHDERSCRGVLKPEMKAVVIAGVRLKKPSSLHQYKKGALSLFVQSRHDERSCRGVLKPEMKAVVIAGVRLKKPSSLHQYKKGALSLFVQSRHDERSCRGVLKPEMKAVVITGVRLKKPSSLHQYKKGALSLFENAFLEGNGVVLSGLHCFFIFGSLKSAGNSPAKLIVASSVLLTYFPCIHTALLAAVMSAFLNADLYRLASAYFVAYGLNAFV